MKTPNLAEAIAKAIARADLLGENLSELASNVRDRLPEELSTQAEKQDRQRFLENLYRTKSQGDAVFERIIQGNELQDASFLGRGALVARTIMRIVLYRPGGGVLGYGTGFLVGDGVLITNNHVLPDKADAVRAVAEAFYERDIYGQDKVPWRFDLDPSLFYTHKDLDFTMVGVSPVDSSGQHKLAELGWLPLIGGAGKAVEGEWLTIVQHPQGEQKQLCVRENQLIKRDADVLWYSTDTLAGSSGSPAFNNDWLVVALHHSGVPETENGKWQTVDGQDYDPRHHAESEIKWKANEGIRVSRIVETVRAARESREDARLQAVVSTDLQDLRVRLPVLYKLGFGPPADALDRTTVTAKPSLTPPPERGPAFQKEDDMAEKLVTVTLAVDDDGSVRVVRQQGGSESFVLERSGTKEKKNIISAPVRPEIDWKGGFDPDFLGTGNLRVNLPKVTRGAVAELLDAYGQTFTSTERKAGELKYKGYSIIMNKDRRFAFFSAANVDGGMRPEISGRDDDWMFDDRIARDHQVDNSFYKGKTNHFDRGHLTRRDDMEWGSDPVDAVNRANGTCTWTNCAPQHAIFNQGKDKAVLLWQNLEKYILEKTAADHKFKVQVITGPVFGVADPEFRGIAYPLDYWKVVVAVTRKGSLFATAYLLSQKETLDKHPIVEAQLDVPFGEFATYQRKVSKIEELTGLKFTFGNNKPLSEVDPLDGLKGTNVGPARSTRGFSPNEAMEFSSGGLGDFDDIILVK